MSWLLDNVVACCARSLLERLHAYLLQIRDELLPKSEAGQTVAYTLKNWTALTRAAWIIWIY
jgi:hypothetical protein